MRSKAGMTDRIIVRIPAEQKRKLMAVARQRNMSLSEMLRQAGSLFEARRVGEF
ncbi:hypothetical protein BPNPMPFG_005048 [Mesorhizobium sp. AR07]|uniref:hypothetical protein n=1 Tax=Mesorhizobium sp. AR07 TaxID=2865838 RepID=UPI00215F931E|nr:hypothetical protein [Mesorhizobium sp. AR07]UVK43270.1 hypothetical protein BPNPMPFG_005048 [Mesorhizobium sp. AR07]